MKRYFILLTLVFSIFNGYANEFSIKTGTGVVGDKINNVFLFNSLENATIEFSSEFIDSTGCKWYKYTEDPYTAEELPASAFSTDTTTSTLLKLSADCGYIVEFGDTACDLGNRCRAYMWCTQYKPIQSVSFPNPEEACESIDLRIEPVMTYVDKNGTKKVVKRFLNYSYSNFVLNETTFLPETAPVKGSNEADSLLTISPTPAIDTKFTLIDTLSKKLMGKEEKYDTDTFYTEAVVAYPIMKVDMKVDQEVDANSSNWKKDAEGRVMMAFSETFEQAIADTSNFKTSAPVTIDLMCIPSERVSNTGFVWDFIQGVYAEQGNFDGALPNYNAQINAYKFEEPGLHCVRLTVTSVNGKCKSSSYGCFRVAESGLWIPNAFSPNGDGDNDEFRVAYRSISSFECNIYDEWGNKVYESDDITTGWDGDGHSLGVYFYIIEAKGTDGVSYKKKGTVSLLREK